MQGAGMQQAVEKVFFSLIRFEINGNESCDEIKNLITPDVLPALFKLSKRHDLAHLIGDALDKSGLLPEGTEVKKRFLRERNMAVYRYEQQQYELEQICEVLKKAKIPFIPLKGAVMRQYYPEAWMRTSCDIDILIREENLQQVIGVLQEKIDYRYENTGNHDAHLFAESGVHLELHYKLNPNHEPWNALLESIWGYLIDGKAYHGVLTQEMFYFYHIAHMAGHFKVGGCGVRSFLDLFLLRKCISYNQEVLDGLLEQGGLESFNQAACALSDYWFGDGKATSFILELNDFILNAGMYGDMENRVAIVKAGKKSKCKILFSRIILPYEQLKYKYPTLQKWPILYPFYVVKRMFLLFNKDTKKRAVNEFNQTVNGDIEKQDRIAKLLKNLNLQE